MSVIILIFLFLYLLHNLAYFTEQIGFTHYLNCHHWLTKTKKLTADVAIRLPFIIGKINSAFCLSAILPFAKENNAILILLLILCIINLLCVIPCYTKMEKYNKKGITF